MIRVERSFPKEVIVRDAEYVLREDPTTVLPQTDPNQPYFGRTPNVYRGQGTHTPPYNASCPIHHPPETWWADLADRFPDHVE